MLTHSWTHLLRKPHVGKLIALLTLLIAILTWGSAEAGASTISSLQTHTTTEPIDGQLPQQIATAKALVPAGEFTMGCNPTHNGGFDCPTDELPLHSVYVSAFEIDITEVTLSAYVAFLNARGSNDCNGVECVDLDDPETRISQQNGQFVVTPGYDNYPAIEVTWYGAATYCAVDGGRLPTEAEWEKAARGTTSRAYPWGDGAPSCSLANSKFRQNNSGDYCIGDSVTVGSYPDGASPYGVLDMGGNLWEWVSDWRSDTYYQNSPHTDPTGPAAGTWKVIRGGAWDYPAHALLAANRYKALPAHSGNSIGFRCVSTPSQ